MAIISNISNNCQVEEGKINVVSNISNNCQIEDGRINVEAAIVFVGNLGYIGNLQPGEVPCFSHSWHYQCKISNKTEFEFADI